MKMENEIQENRKTRNSRITHFKEGVSKITLPLVILIGGLVLLGSAWYMYQHRQVIICTDSVWNEVYLQQNKRAEQLKINLWNDFYIPGTEIIPFESADQGSIEKICSRRTGSIFVYSPYLTSKLDIEQLTKAFPKKTFLLWEEFAENKLVSPQVNYLCMDPEALASICAKALEDVVTNRSVDNEGEGRIKVVWNSEGRFSLSVIEKILSKLKNRFPEQGFELTDLADSTENSAKKRDELRIAQQDILLLLDGEADQLQSLLNRIKSRGAQAVVFGEGALKGWPGGVAAEIVIDVKTTLVEALKKGLGKQGKETPSGTGAASREAAGCGIAGPETVKKPAARRFTIHLAIRR